MMGLARRKSLWVRVVQGTMCMGCVLQGGVDGIDESGRGWTGSTECICVCRESRCWAILKLLLLRWGATWIETQRCYSIE